MGLSKIFVMMWAFVKLNKHSLREQLEVLSWYRLSLFDMKGPTWTFLTWFSGSKVSIRRCLSSGKGFTAAAEEGKALE